MFVEFELSFKLNCIESTNKLKFLTTLTVLSRTTWGIIYFLGTEDGFVCFVDTVSNNLEMCIIYCRGCDFFHWFWLREVDCLCWLLFYCYSKFKYLEGCCCFFSDLRWHKKYMTFPICTLWLYPLVFVRKKMFVSFDRSEYTSLKPTHVFIQNTIEIV